MSGLVIRDSPVLHHDARPAGARIGAIVVHDTGGRTAASTLTWFNDPSSRVSSHYLIDRDGTIYRLVPDARRAWHAGVSMLFGRERLNDWTLGLELVDADDGEPYPQAQVASLVDLLAELCRTYTIPLNRVVGHQHVSVPAGRKVDPGKDFDWYTVLLAVGRVIYP